MTPITPAPRMTIFMGAAPDRWTSGSIGRPAGGMLAKTCFRSETLQDSCVLYESETPILRRLDALAGRSSVHSRRVGAAGPRPARPLPGADRFGYRLRRTLQPEGASRGGRRQTSGGCRCATFISRRAPAWSPFAGWEMPVQYARRRHGRAPPHPRRRLALRREPHGPGHPAAPPRDRGAGARARGADARRRRRASPRAASATPSSPTTRAASSTTRWWRTAATTCSSSSTPATATPTSPTCATRLAGRRGRGGRRTARSSPCRARAPRRRPRRSCPAPPRCAFMDSATLAWQGHDALDQPVRLHRRGRLRDLGPRRRRRGLRARAPRGRASLPAGLGARDSLRLEAGLPLHGADIDRTTSPVEAGARLVRRARPAGPGGARAGGFPGADRILRQMEHGVAPPARRPAPRRPPAGARRRRDHGARGPCGPRHLRHLRPDRCRRPRRDGLRRRRPRRARHPSRGRGAGPRPAPRRRPPSLRPPRLQALRFPMKFTEDHEWLRARGRRHRRRRHHRARRQGAGRRGLRPAARHRRDGRLGRRGRRDRERQGGLRHPRAGGRRDRRGERGADATSPASSTRTRPAPPGCSRCRWTTSPCSTSSWTRTSTRRSIA